MISWISWMNLLMHTGRFVYIQSWPDSDLNDPINRQVFASRQRDMPATFPLLQMLPAAFVLENKTWSWGRWLGSHKAT